jgi:hypothetical protein
MSETTDKTKAQAEAFFSAALFKILETATDAREIIGPSGTAKNILARLAEQ